MIQCASVLSAGLLSGLCIQLKIVKLLYFWDIARNQAFHVNLNNELNLNIRMKVYHNQEISFVVYIGGNFWTSKSKNNTTFFYLF